MRDMVFIAGGGAMGAVLRYLLAGWVQSGLRVHGFPVGTLAVNVLGCLVIGVLGGWAESVPALHSQVRAFLFIGLLGGFTTFSSFGYETLALLRDGQMFLGLANVASQLVLGLTAVWLGYGLTCRV